jgi:hypothetical protein
MLYGPHDPASDGSIHFIEIGDSEVQYGVVVRGK